MTNLTITFIFLNIRSYSGPLTTYKGTYKSPLKSWNSIGLALLQKAELNQ